MSTIIFIRINIFNDKYDSAQLKFPRINSAVFVYRESKEPIWWIVSKNLTNKLEMLRSSISLLFVLVCGPHTPILFYAIPYNAILCYAMLLNSISQVTSTATA